MSSPAEVVERLHLLSKWVTRYLAEWSNSAEVQADIDRAADLIESQAQRIADLEGHVSYAIDGELELKARLEKAEKVVELARPLIEEQDTMKDCGCRTHRTPALAAAIKEYEDE